MNFKRMTALVLAAAVAAGTLSGCGINKNATVATLGDEKVSLGLVNFFIHYSEAGSDDMYKSYFGDDFMEEDLYGNGNTFFEDMRDEMVDSVHTYYTLADADHMSEYSVELTDDETAAITAAASQFISDNSKTALNEMSATQDIVEEALRLITISQKMIAAIKATADTNVTDEECACRAYTIVTAATDSYYDSTSGTTTDYTDDEKSQLEASFNYIYSMVQYGSSLEDSANALGLSVSTDTYNSADTDLDEELISTLDGLKVGETAMLETDTDLYIVRIDSDYDEDASESKKEEIISDRQQDVYDTQLEEWQTDDGWTVNEKALNTIVFDNYMTSATETEDTESTESATEAVTTTEAN